MNLNKTENEPKKYAVMLTYHELVSLKQDLGVLPSNPQERYTAFLAVYDAFEAAWEARESTRVKITELEAQIVQLKKELA